MKFLEIKEFVQLNMDLVKIIHISKAQNETEKYWVCFVFDRDYTYYVECETEAEAQSFYNQNLVKLVSA